jgi:hypothetical protein
MVYKQELLVFQAEAGLSASLLKTKSLNINLKPAKLYKFSPDRFSNLKSCSGNKAELLPKLI